MMVTRTTTHHFAGVSCLTAPSSNQRRINSNIYCKKHTVVTNGDRTVTAEERPKLNLKGNSGDSGIVAVNPKPQKGLAAKVIDFVEGLIVKFMHDSSRPLHYLSGNTALIYHHGKLLVLSEIDKPYVLKVLKDGDLQTLGMLDYDKRLNHPFTAHPKIDPYTDEMFTFGYTQTPPYVTYRVISKDGFMHDPVPITMSAPIMMHDFAITENYAIFLDLPMCFRQKEMVKENKLIYAFDPTIKARFGVLPRYARDDLQIRWFELPNCYIFHNANAWEEEDEVVLITCRVRNPDLDMFNGPLKETLEDQTTELYEMRFNMKTGLASQKKLSPACVDFPRINEHYMGRKQRYVYGSILENIAKVTGIIKFDLRAEPETGKTKLEVGGNVKGIFDLGPGRFGSEAVFVPREPSSTSEEDDGYLIFHVHDENTGKSAVYVIDAKTMSADPVAVIELPHRVPYGFHGIFLSEEQLEELAKL